jgi:predicted peroxiredoxin
MLEKLGIAVATRENIDHVLGLARASGKAGKKTEVFLTGEGVHLTQAPRFPELLEVARVGVCETSYIARGYRGKEVPGLVDKDFVTQARNAEMVDECDRYIVL